MAKSTEHVLLLRAAKSGGNGCVAALFGAVVASPACTSALVCSGLSALVQQLLGQGPAGAVHHPLLAGEHRGGKLEMEEIVIRPQLFVGTHNF